MTRRGGSLGLPQMSPPAPPIEVAIGSARAAELAARCLRCLENLQHAVGMQSLIELPHRHVTPPFGEATRFLVSLR
jgi:hypothetical protein